MRRLTVLLLLALLPLQSAFAAGGLWCALSQARTSDVAPATHAHEHEHQAAHGHTSGNTPGQAPTAHDHGTCATCAPCCGAAAVGQFAPAPVSFPDAAGADFPPIAVRLVVAPRDGLERPPRTI